MNKHAIWMIIGCVIPLLLIFLLPILGVSNNVAIFIFIIFMFGCHLMMAGGHHGHDHGKKNHDEKKENHSHNHTTKNVKRQ